MTKIDLPAILKEFGADMRLRDSENMGPTRCEVALATEVARLREALKVANSQAEDFERKWYLRGDELDALREAAGKVTCATCGNGGEFPRGSGRPCPDCSALRALFKDKTCLARRVSDDTPLPRCDQHPNCPCGGPSPLDDPSNFCDGDEPWELEP